MSCNYNNFDPFDDFGDPFDLGEQRRSNYSYRRRENESDLVLMNNARFNNTNDDDLDDLDDLIQELIRLRRLNHCIRRCIRRF